MTLTIGGAVQLIQIDSSLSAAYSTHYFARHSSASASGVTVSVANAPSSPDTGVPQWELNRVGHSSDASLGAAGATAQSHVVHKPASPEGIHIVCRLGGQTAEATIWFIEATVSRSPSGRVPGAGNPAWGRVSHSLTTTYRLSGMPNLGLFHATFGTQYALRRGVRYGEFVEFIGTVRPLSFNSVPVQVFLGRQFVANPAVQSLDASGAALPDDRGANTPSRSAGQDDILGVLDAAGSNRLTSQGHVYDYDMPGSEFTRANQVGDSHRWNVQFREAVFLGRPANLGAGVANGQVISNWLPWHVSYTATCTVIASPAIAPATATDAGSPAAAPYPTVTIR